MRNKREKKNSVSTIHNDKIIIIRVRRCDNGNRDEHWVDRDSPVSLFCIELRFACCYAAFIPRFCALHWAAKRTFPFGIVVNNNNTSESPETNGLAIIAMRRQCRWRNKKRLISIPSLPFCQFRGTPQWHIRFSSIRLSRPRIFNAHCSVPTVDFVQIFINSNVLLNCQMSDCSVHFIVRSFASLAASPYLHSPRNV